MQSVRVYGGCGAYVVRSNAGQLMVVVEVWWWWWTRSAKCGGGVRTEF